MTHPPPDAGQPAETPRKRNPKGTHDRLVRAALDLFTTKGYHDSTTPEIAQRAGVAEGTIYRHFRSKEHLLNEIYRSSVRTFIRGVTDSSAPECRGRLEAVAVVWRDLAARDPAVVRVVLARRFVNLLDEQSRAVYTELRQELEKVIAAGKASGAVRAGAAAPLVDVWLRLATLMVERVANREWKPEDVAVRMVIDSAWDAIRVQTTSSSSQGSSP